MIRSMVIWLFTSVEVGFPFSDIAATPFRNESWAFAWDLAVSITPCACTTQASPVLLSRSSSNSCRCCWIHGHTVRTLSTFCCLSIWVKFKSTTSWRGRNPHSKIAGSELKPSSCKLSLWWADEQRDRKITKLKNCYSYSEKCKTFSTSSGKESCWSLFSADSACSHARLKST